MRAARRKTARAPATGPHQARRESQSRSCAGKPSTTSRRRAARRSALVVNHSGELPKRPTHLDIREICVAAARIWKDEHARAFKRLRLHAEPDGPALREDRPKKRHTHERHQRWFVPPDFAPQDDETCGVFCGRERIDAGRRARYQVRDPESPLRKPPVVFRPDRLRHEPGFGQQPPETIRIPGEVMTDERRADAGVDADEQHADTGFDAIAKPGESTGGHDDMRVPQGIFLYGKAAFRFQD